MTVLQWKLLRCTKGSSNKGYRIELQDHGTHFVVRAWNGKWGCITTDAQNAPFDTIDGAQRKYDSLIADKLSVRKSYFIVDEGAEGESAISAPPAPTRSDTGLRAQLL